MAKSKKDEYRVYIMAAAAIVGVLIGASYLGYNVIAFSTLTTMGLLAGAIVLLLYSGVTKGDLDKLDWTITVASVLLIAHYLVAAGTVYQGIDVHQSLMISTGLAGVILLMSRVK